MTCSFALYNDRIISSDEKLFGLDGFSELLFSERIRAVRNVFPFFTETLQLIQLKLRLFNCAFPPFIQHEGKELKRQMERLLVKNKLFKSALLTILFVRNKNEVSILISAELLEESEFLPNTKGLLTDVFAKTDKAISSLSSLSLGSQMLWNVANAHLADTGLDAFLLINSDEMIIESPENMLLAFHGDKITTVSPAVAAFVDPAASYLPGLAAKCGFAFSVKDGFAEDELRDADELALFNSLYGFRWVLGFREKRYYNSKVRTLVAALNKMVTSQ